MTTEEKAALLVKSIRDAFGTENVPDWLVKICFKRAEGLSSRVDKNPKNLSFNQMYSLILKSGALKQALNEVRSDSPNPRLMVAAENGLKNMNKA